jgi:hypothetical protein
MFRTLDAQGFDMAGMFAMMIGGTDLSGWMNWPRLNFDLSSMENHPIYYLLS